MTVQTSADILREALALIDTRGWACDDSGSRLSIYSAISIVMFGKTALDLGMLELLLLARGDGPCGFVQEAVGGGYKGVADWEMRRDRMKEEVVGVMHAAIALAELHLSKERAA